MKPDEHNWTFAEYRNCEDCIPRHHWYTHVVKMRRRLREALESEGIL